MFCLECGKQLEIGDFPYCDGYPAWHDPEKNRIWRLRGKKGKPLLAQPLSPAKPKCNITWCENTISDGETFCARCQSNLDSWVRVA